MLIAYFALPAFLAIRSFAIPPESLLDTPPTVNIDNATVVGIADSATGTNSFLGIPFAHPPVGSLRLNLPQPITSYQGTINATNWGNQCFNTVPFGLVLPDAPWVTQEMSDYLEIFDHLAPAPFDEDCLNINVIAPSNAKPGDKLPVVAYIFFSGFDFSGSSNVDGRVMVNRSVELGEPVIWVAMNYRLGPYGFLPGRQIGSAGLGNLGLQDQREGLRWIQKYIEKFGGNPGRVVLLGLSAGAASSSLQTVGNGGNSENLFHGVWAESGALQHIPRIDEPVAQVVFDNFVAAVNCSDAPEDQVLQCIRDIDTTGLQNVVGTSNHAFWDVAVDGTFLQESPQRALVQGKIANVPIVTGIAQDDGTLAVLAYPNGTDNATLAGFVRDTFPNITNQDLEYLFELYPDVPSEGAPFHTDDQYQLTEQYKRLGALSCDMGFDSNHRLLAESLATHGRDVWSYYYQRNFIYGFGVTHGTEIPNMYGGGDMADMFIHFVNTLDPNGANPKKYWPKYTIEEPVMLAFTGNDTLDYVMDTYRATAIGFINYLNVFT